MRIDTFILPMIIIATASTIFTTGCPTRLVVKANSEREAEVKSNIHTIQIALERYAVDTGGYYPNFLVGAEADNNIIVNQESMASNGISKFPPAGVTPWAQVYDESGGPRTIIRSDPLIANGYLSEYPVNPFADRFDGRFASDTFDKDSMSGLFPYGGLHGDKMFDLGFGWGDTPQTDFLVLTNDELTETREARISGGTLFSDPDLDAPGNFYYHQIFSDAVPVYYHYAAQYDVVNNGPKNWSGFGILDHKVVGYSLYGYGAPGNPGSPDEGGLDYFNRMVYREHMPDDSKIDGMLPDGLVLDTSIYYGEKQDLLESTGYPSYEYDPWTLAFADGIDPAKPGIIQPRKSGADGINDWVIIEVSSGNRYPK